MVFICNWIFFIGNYFMLLDTLNTKITEAMKSGDKHSLDVFRMAKTALMNASIAKADHTLSPDEEIAIMQKEVKKRRDSIEMYTTGGRLELAEKEAQEAEILAQFLPAQVSDEDIEAIVQKAVTESGATTKQEMGRVMGLVMPQLKGKAEPGRISAAVMKHLA